MAEVTIEIGGWRYDVACRDGEEDHLRHLASLVDAKSAKVRATMGGVNEVRQLLLASILLADELNDAQAGAPVVVAPAADRDPVSIPSGVALAIERLAERVERVADRLEGEGATP